MTGLSMKKPSKRWLEFCQLIEIIDIRIGKKQRQLVKLKHKLQGLSDLIEQKWRLISLEQHKLKNLVVQDEIKGLSRLFQRRESVKSCIESIFFDVSVAQKNADKLQLEIEQVNVAKRRLETRKDALGEILEQLRDQ